MKIGIVSGYFKILYIWHIQLFNQAKKYCDHLIAIINNDEQLKNKKGGVVVDQFARAAIISSLRYVDQIIISKSQDATVNIDLENIRQHNPNHELSFFNGGDVFRENLREKEVCQLNNIKTVFLIGDKADSTTDISQRIIERHERRSKS